MRHQACPPLPGDFRPIPSARSSIPDIARKNHPTAIQCMSFKVRNFVQCAMFCADARGKYLAANFPAPEGGRHALRSKHLEHL
jgi:hypothetical protein